ncbi:hypothetical protein [Enterobacter pseudoroggenkampii]|uniref:MAE-28990/MAE-18760-like HEPN domain-containing protein n=1 Tax=Enterobacter pseudoroggenkampii TaxID=2996112 RepID=A0ABT3XDG0_9ENTR|nr:hypothetical protein [Enterobacter pseudoroggenkampii]MCK6907000.1 hypothetical protein [Enterobacter roggenkampii]MCX8303842.1 hypothetical protein [Enterobacter pseudoroggenkampii]
MDWNRVNVWTRTLYTLVHSLHMAKEVDFGDKSSLNERIRDANSWISPICSYSTTLLPPHTNKKRIEFRRDPNVHFDEISSQVIKMLIQDLTVIFDEMMADAMVKLKFNPDVFPQSKVEKLSTLLHADYEWSKKGCLELIAVRNSLCHANGRWNTKSLNLISGFINPMPASGDEIIVGFEMIFNYRKAIRTFLNETCPPEATPKLRKKKKRSSPSKKQLRRILKQERKERGRQAMKELLNETKN